MCESRTIYEAFYTPSKYLISLWSVNIRFLPPPLPSYLAFTHTHTHTHPCTHARTYIMPDRQSHRSNTLCAGAICFCHIVVSFINRNHANHTWTMASSHLANNRRRKRKKISTKLKRRLFDSKPTMKWDVGMMCA